jgi:hypothetical protein
MAGIKRMINSLKINNESFNLFKTTFTTKLIWNDTEFKETKNGFIPKNELYFINMVKQHVLKNSSGVYCNRAKIKYVKEGKIKKSVNYTKDLYEIDLNSAYWNFAFKSKFIDEKLYLRGRKVSKMTRLVSLGNLAKRTQVLNFNGKEYKLLETLKSPETEGVFFSVSLQTDEVMRMLETIADTCFLFYWVDAIFFQGKKKKTEIENYLKSQNVEFKVKKLDKIFKSKLGIAVFDKKGIRNFNLNKI